MNRYRFEDPHCKALVTTRTVDSRLWFVNNEELHQAILGSVAKYQNSRGAHLYAFVIQGNHYHGIGRFPLGNRADFQRDLNSSIQRHVTYADIGFDGGTLWSKRYSAEFLPSDSDVENYFFYCALQTVHSGLCEDPRDFNGYNSFWDAIEGRVRKYKVFDRAGYNDKRRYNKKVRREDFISEYELIIARLPGYENLSQEDYRELMLVKYEARRRRLIDERRALGLGFLGKAKLAATRPGSYPKNTKKSKRNSIRPIVLTDDIEVRRDFSERYFRLKDLYKRAARNLRLQIGEVRFPPYMYVRSNVLSNALGFPLAPIG